MPCAKTAWASPWVVLRECPVLDIKFVACGHNTIRGAAGAAVLNAELMASEGFLDYEENLWGRRASCAPVGNRRQSTEL